jgi:hypothetical protein
MTDTLRSQDPRWQTVAGAYNAAGVTPFLDLEVLPEGVVYMDRRVALAGDPQEYYAISLHDLGHLLVAPRARRSNPNFGLGGHPTVAETGQRPEQVTLARGINEEGAASVVNILLALVLFGRDEAEMVSDFLCFDHYPPDADQIDPEYRRILARARVFQAGTFRLTLPWELARYLRTHGQGPVDAFLGMEKRNRYP